MFDEEILAGMSFGPPGPAARSSVRLQLRLPWYRTLPLSCLEELKLTVDGDEVGAEDLSVVVGGEPRPLSSVKDLHRVGWFVLDTIDVELAASKEYAPGAHLVKVAMRLRIPYGDKDYRIGQFGQVAECERELTLLARDE